MMPTRYTLELEGLKNSLTMDTFKEQSARGLLILSIIFVDFSC